VTDRTEAEQLAALVEIEQNLLRDFIKHGFDDSSFLAGVVATFAARMVRVSMQASPEVQQAEWTQLCAEAWADSDGT
jgi:hypothetical protein